MGEYTENLRKRFKVISKIAADNHARVTDLMLENNRLRQELERVNSHDNSSESDINWEANYRALAQVERAHAEQIGQLITRDKVKSGTAIAALVLAETILQANDIYHPSTQEIINNAIDKLKS